MTGRSLLLACIGVVAIGCAACAAIAYHPAIARIRPPDAALISPARVARGAELAAIGDCAVCHTEAHGPRLAGGRGVPTPFGTIYATNITPDADTGIGTWSEAAFRRAMRDGIARDGSHLYPVLPYPHFTRATDADLAAIYAYLMTRDPVHAVPPANHLPFPLDQRVLLTGGNLLFLRPGPWQRDPAHDATWNHGAYLVEAIGHCGACHTPHNALGAEENSDRLAGGEAEGWWAPPLQASSPARVPWTEAQLAAYLRTGFAAEHGAAALIARAIPGRPIRVQWMREDEHLHEPYGPAMVAEIVAGVDADGHIVTWDYQVWSNTHSRRPNFGGLMLQNAALPDPLPVPPPAPLPMPEGGGDRNSIPLYMLPNARVVYHFIPEMPLRVSALRSLGAYLNVFAIESAMDELANAAKVDPVQFRLRHLQDDRARAVIALAAEKFGWDKTFPGSGRGFAFARYKNLAAYCAIALQLSVQQETGRVRIGRVVAAVDSGQPINPDGIRNQIEGAIVQSASWTLYEQVRFDRDRIISADWSTYPIMRFESVPESVEVHIVNRPGLPFLGTGEAGQGPTAAAIANAIADATNVRLRELPLTR